MVRTNGGDTVSTEAVAVLYFPASTMALITAALTPFFFKLMRALVEALVEVSNWYFELAIFARMVASSKPALTKSTMSWFWRRSCWPSTVPGCALDAVV
jgi:hypothetical protein